jgi:soluble lytic murein transglycosylase-like protein
MTASDFIAMAKAAAEAVSLDPALVCAVCEQESSWNPWALRYEPGFLSRYVMPLFSAGKISATEAYARAMSWGLMQIMGETAREFGLPDAMPLPTLCDPATGLEYGCKKLADCWERARGDETKALLLWNGGGDANYPAEVQARKAKYA